MSTQKNKSPERKPETPTAERKGATTTDARTQQQTPEARKQQQEEGTERRSTKPTEEGPTSGGMGSRGSQGS